MTISNLFLVCLTILVISGVAALINFAIIAKNMFGSVQNMDMDRGFQSMNKGIGLHIIFGGIAALASLGCFVSGVIWIIQAIKA